MNRQEATKRTVPTEHFVVTLSANALNAKLSDAPFRELVVNTLPIVEFAKEMKKKLNLQMK